MPGIAIEAPELTMSTAEAPFEVPATEVPTVEASAIDEVPATEASAIEAPLETPIAQASIKAPSVVETPETVENSVEEISIDEMPVVDEPVAEEPAVRRIIVEARSLKTPPREVPPAETPPELQPSRDIDSIEPTRDMVIAETETVLDIEPTRETIIGDSAVIFSGAAAASIGAASNTPPLSTATTAAIGEDDPPSTISSLAIEELADVDNDLSDLPEGYGESRIVLLPRDSEWAYAYWDVSNEHKERLRQQGGQRLMLRLYDVTDIDLTSQSPHSMQQVDCHEMARSWYLEMPVSDREYLTEIGYLTADDRWLLLARSASIRVPPVYPSDWVKDQFVTIDWQEQLTGRSFGDLGRPYSPKTSPAVDSAAELPKIYSDLFALTQSQEALRVTGSLYGSMQQTPPGALSPSGGAFGSTGPTALSASGLNMSGLNMSGIESGASELPARSRQFWLTTDAELIVYGATEPDATLMVGDKVIPLNPDGTFRFHVAFPDGQIDYPIRAIAADGEQTRSVRLDFERETPERDTNTTAEAEDEWF